MSATDRLTQKRQIANGYYRGDTEPLLTDENYFAALTGTAPAKPTCPGWPATWR